MWAVCEENYLFFYNEYRIICSLIDAGHVCIDLKEYFLAHIPDFYIDIRMHNVL